VDMLIITLQFKCHWLSCVLPKALKDTQTRGNFVICFVCKILVGKS